MKRANPIIVYSKVGSQKVTEALDYVLNVRDILFFSTLFRGCEAGWLKNGEYKRNDKNTDENRPIGLKQLMRTRHFWITLLLSFPICLITILPAFKEAVSQGSGDYGILVVDLLMLVPWLLFYKILFRTTTVHIYWGEEKDPVLWENREDHKCHLWSEPVFFDFYDKRINDNKEAYNNSVMRDKEDCYLEAARDLSWLRCLGLISESIQQFADQFCDGNIEIEILEDDGCTDTNRNGEYTILLKGSKGDVPDAIIPVDAQTEKQSYTMPFVIGESLVRKYRETGVLDLAIFDSRYEKIIESGIIAKKEEQGKDEE